VPMHTKFKPLFSSITEALPLTSRVVNFVTDLMKISLLYGLARRRSGRGARAKGCLGGDFLSLEV
jgi:hypothetical protein